MSDDRISTDQIGRFLDRYGQALSAGDLPGIVTCWAVPALVLADDGVVAVAETGAVERFFAQAVEWYRAQGLTATRPNWSESRR